MTIPDTCALAWADQSARDAVGLEKHGIALNQSETITEDLVQLGGIVELHMNRPVRYMALVEHGFFCARYDEQARGAPAAQFKIRVRRIRQE